MKFYALFFSLLAITPMSAMVYYGPRTLGYFDVKEAPISVQITGTDVLKAHEFDRPIEAAELFHNIDLSVGNRIQVIWGGNILSEYAIDSDTPKEIDLSVNKKQIKLANENEKLKTTSYWGPRKLRSIDVEAPLVVQIIRAKSIYSRTFDHTGKGPAEINKQTPIKVGYRISTIWGGNKLAEHVVDSDDPKVLNLAIFKNRIEVLPSE